MFHALMQRAHDEVLLADPALNALLRRGLADANPEVIDGVLELICIRLQSHENPEIGHMASRKLAELTARAAARQSDWGFAR